MIIKLKNYSIPQPGSILQAQRLYSVYLGNGARVNFASERDCRAYLAETNRFLNDQLLHLNAIFGQLCSEYRRVWPYFITGKSKSGALNAAHTKITKQINDITWTFERMAIDCGQNYNHFAVKQLLSVAADLAAMATAIEAVHRLKSNAPDAANLKAIAKVCAGVESEIFRYGKN